MEKMNSHNQYTENDLEILWKKWTNYQVSDDIQELCFIAVKPIEHFFFEITQSCLNLGIYPSPG